MTKQNLPCAIRKTVVGKLCFWHLTEDCCFFYFDRQCVEGCAIKKRDKRKHIIRNMFQQMLKTKINNIIKVERLAVVVPSFPVKKGYKNVKKVSNPQKRLLVSVNGFAII